MRIAATGKARVGVCARQLRTGQSIRFNPEQRFAQASVYKLPIAIQLLRCVEAGQFTLDNKIEVLDTDISPGSGMIKDNLLPGATLSLQNLLSLTLRVSDNTASDILLRLAGGANAVSAWLQSVNLSDIRVDRTTKQMLADFYGVATPASATEWSIQTYRARYNALSDETKRAAQSAFLTDERDTCTPQAMVMLLVKLQRGLLLNPTHTDLLLTYLRTSQMSPGRIKGLLPPGTGVAHKGGTLGDCVINDVGLIRLPDQAGEVALSIFSKGAPKSLPEQERIIAHIARSLYDYFLFTG